MQAAFSALPNESGTRDSLVGWAPQSISMLLHPEVSYGGLWVALESLKRLVGYLIAMKSCRGGKFRFA